jgi:hypothetical protein
MAHFAEIDTKNSVLRVLVVPDEQEHRGSQYLSTDLRLGGNWVQCSYNNNIRKQFPSEGYFYDDVNDVFIAPRPFPSWTLDNNFDWQPPTPQPSENIYEAGHVLMWNWNEEEQKWDKHEEYFNTEEI